MRKENEKNKSHSVLDTESLLVNSNEILNQVQDDVKNRGFTLIEILVAVLIIGILTAVAVPQYQNVVEKSRMTEAISLTRTIARANQLYYIENGQYLDFDEIGKMDIAIPGVQNTQHGRQRIQTNNFIYSPRGQGKGFSNLLALAHRLSSDPEKIQIYYIYITQEEPEKIRCQALVHANTTQKKLCQKLDVNGFL